MARIQCFMVEDTSRGNIFLRRFTFKCPVMCPFSGSGYHNAKTQIDVRALRFSEDGFIEPEDPPPHNDPRWPLKCECGYEFKDADEWQVFIDHLYKSVDGEVQGEWGYHDLPPGAMLYPSWLNNRYEGNDEVVLQGRARYWPGPDRKILMVVTPGGQWIIDSRASNCDKPEDNTHHCWVRHGIAPLITVDKNGNTCGAGGGSIQCGAYHGFLKNGWLEEA